MIEKTFAMIKPDAVSAKNVGNIINIIEQNQFSIIKLEKRTLTETLAREFYKSLASKSFFDDLIKFITSGPVIVMALEKENAISAWRELIGATDPSKAAEGTIRKRFSISIDKNAVHGSDAAETAKIELKLIFPDLK